MGFLISWLPTLSFRGLGKVKNAHLEFNPYLPSSWTVTNRTCNYGNASFYCYKSSVKAQNLHDPLVLTLAAKESFCLMMPEFYTKTCVLFHHLPIPLKGHTDLYKNQDWLQVFLSHYSSLISLTPHPPPFITYLTDVWPAN